MSPEKGGALRNQSTGGRRLGVAAIICGVLFGAPLLLLQNSSASSPRAAERGAGGPQPAGRAREGCRRVTQGGCEPAFASRRVSSAYDVIDVDVFFVVVFVDHDHGAGTDNDNHDGPGAAAHHNDRATAAAHDDHDDDCAAGTDEQ